MLKIVIVTDGPYGERAYDHISKEFDTEFIELEQPTSMFADDIEIPEDALKEIRGADILITYTLHPDLTLDLVELLHDKVKWIIVAAWRGDGFKNQVERFGNVTCPENMCDLQENGNPVFDEFVSKFGRPIVKVNCQGDKIVDIEVLRSSPCGSTFFVAEEMIGQDLEDLPIKAGLKLQHYPCRAPKMRLFADDECKKEMAANFHKEAFENAIKKKKEN
ncbi:MAG: DUF166 domain-containing protein [Methanobacterium sp.]|uniref:DUF166 domain-containing protein n=1 Tax=Methanobacterium sp. TaxID=2164 RepID=UPI003D650341|nr:DUF166 domain-containing protein [Methanobacterium sp.]